MLIVQSHGTTLGLGAYVLQRKSLDMVADEKRVIDRHEITQPHDRILAFISNSDGTYSHDPYRDLVIS